MFKIQWNRTTHNIFVNSNARTKQKGKSDRRFPSEDAQKKKFLNSSFNASHSVVLRHVCSKKICLSLPVGKRLPVKNLISQKSFSENALSLKR